MGFESLEVAVGFAFAIGAVVVVVAVGATKGVAEGATEGSVIGATEGSITASRIGLVSTLSVLLLAEPGGVEAGGGGMPSARGVVAEGAGEVVSTIMGYQRTKVADGPVSCLGGWN